MFKNKTVLITGASSGIGAACAEKFATEHANLILLARDGEKLETVKNNILKNIKHKININNVICDVSDYNQIKNIINNKKNKNIFNNIDVLINNAGLVLGLELIDQSDVRDWEQMIDVNIKGLLYITREILPTMIEKSSGHVINIGSIAGHDVYPKGHVYCATKFAVKALCKALRTDLYGTNIRVTSIDPGAVKTNLSLVRFKGDVERAKKVYEGYRPLLPEDIASAVFYAASCPSHVNIDTLIITPTDRPFVVYTAPPTNLRPDV